MTTRFRDLPQEEQDRQWAEFVASQQRVDNAEQRKYQREYQARRRAADPEYREECNRRAREGMARRRARLREEAR